jgi:tetratricopeptide (TPR) repeat protein
MMRQIIKKISELEEKQIYNITNNAPKGILLVMILLYAYLTLFTTNINYMRFFLLVVIILVVIIFWIISSVEKISSFILNENIELEKYTNFIFLLYKGAKNKVQKREYFEQYQISEATAMYLKGNFEEALKKLERVNFERITKRHRANYQDMVGYYGCLCNCQLGEFQTTIREFKNLPDNYVSRLEAIKAIKQGKPTDYFEKSHPKTHLESISTNYYLAQNEINSGNPEKAKELFQKIVNENSELFYVREAKKYLEEN